MKRYGVCHEKLKKLPWKIDLKPFTLVSSTKLDVGTINHQWGVKTKLRIWWLDIKVQLGGSPRLIDVWLIMTKVDPEESTTDRTPASNHGTHQWLSKRKTYFCRILIYTACVSQLNRGEVNVFACSRNVYEYIKISIFIAKNSWKSVVLTLSHLDS